MKKIMLAILFVVVFSTMSVASPFKHPIDFSHLEDVQIVKAFRTSALSEATSYDPRITGQVTPVKNQSPHGSCSSFGTIASLESTYLKRTGNIKAFSEWHFLYFSFTDMSPSLPGFTVIDWSPYIGGEPYDLFSQDGSAWQSTAVLSRWNAIVDESVNPWPSDYNWRQQGNVPSLNTAEAVRLEHVYHMRYGRDEQRNSNNFDIQTVKYTISNYGAVSFYLTWNHDSFNFDTNSYNYRGPMLTSGHIATIVGWDDNYSKNNFVTKPTNDGAWLAKNSWGTSWGDGGYFWISYECSTLATPAVFITGDANNFDNIYQYDPLGWSNSYGYNTDTAWFANVFETSNNSFNVKNAENEILKAVSFYTAQTNSTYRIEIRTGITNNNPSSGKLQTIVEGTLNFSGYHTIRFNEDIVLEPNTIFSVVVRLKTPNYNKPIPIEEPIVNYSDKAKAEFNQSFISRDGNEWTDLTAVVQNANVCIKAFTNKSSRVPDVDPIPVDGNSGGGGCSINSFSSFSSILLLAPLALLLKKF